MRHATFQLMVSVIALCIFDAQALGRQRTQERADCSAYVGRKIPTFRVAKKSRTDKGRALVLSISLAPSDVDREKLIALACKLGRDHAAEEGLFVWILDSYRAAKRYSPQGEGNDRQTELAYRGSCGFTRDPQAGYGQTLAWWPDPYDRNRFVHIDLGPPPLRRTK